MLFDASVTWPAVALALIAALPGIIAAWRANSIHNAIKTPSKTPIGRQVEDTNQNTLANNYRLQSLSGDGNGEELHSARAIERTTPPPHAAPPSTPPPAVS